MNAGPLILALLLTGCTGAMSRLSPWQYKATAVSAYTRIPTAQVEPLLRRAEEDFRASPPFPSGGQMPLLFIDAIREANGRISIAFYMGAVADVSAVYIFDSSGNIVDRYLHSWWGRTRSRPRP